MRACCRSGQQTWSIVQFGCTPAMDHMLLDKTTYYWTGLHTTGQDYTGQDRREIVYEGVCICCVLSQLTGITHGHMTIYGYNTWSYDSTTYAASCLSFALEAANFECRKLGLRPGPGLLDRTPWVRVTGQDSISWAYDQGQGYWTGLHG